MKKILYTFLAAVGLMCAVSCSDMLETESNSQLYDPSLSEKTDSVFYAYGILQAMQQLADQYYFQNELRGDLVKTTKYATTDLRDLSTFSADASNKYDSVYLYYQVINNCNYYLKNRKTDLVTGSQYVVMNEYIAVAAIRAWTYLQLVRQYGDVPYITEPVMSISEINAQKSATSSSVILQSEAEYLENLKNTWGPDYCSVPNFGKTKEIQIGGNGSRDKYILPSKCFVPIYLVLGDLYLEDAKYAAAVKSYYDYYYYCSETEKTAVSEGVQRMGTLTKYGPEEVTLPSDIDTYTPSTLANILKDWEDLFSASSAPADVISYIPMATSALQGHTTEVPEAFGYLYYEGTGGSRISYSPSSSAQTPNVQVEPSDEFREKSNSQLVYYKVISASSSALPELSSATLGDMRMNLWSPGRDPYSDRTYVYKPGLGNFFLYRNSTVFLSIAEALNGMGYPDAAFAVLKNGLDKGLVSFVDSAYTHQTFNNPRIRVFGKDRYYLSTKSAEMLSNGADGYAFNFLPRGLESGGNDGTGLFAAGTLCGIHLHGAGYVVDESNVQSPYNYFTVLDKKLAELAEKYPNTGLSAKIAKYGQEKALYDSWLNMLNEDKENALTTILGKYTKRALCGLTDEEIASKTSNEKTEQEVIDEAFENMSNSQIAVAVVRQTYPNFVEYYNTEFTTEDRVNAMEDLICDEYAYETAFEGRRFGDLQRIARHKNERGLYGGGFGNRWLQDKLGFKGFNGVWYLPFK